MKIRKSTLLIVLVFVMRSGLMLPASANDTGTAGQAMIVSAGQYHSAVIDSNHALWMWGHNQYGQLGNSGASNSTYTVFVGYGNKTYKIQTTPVKVLEDVVSVSCGAYFTAAIKADGTLWMWGQNDMGQLGDETTTDRYTPVKVLDQVAAVSCGYSHTAAIRYDGSLWMWGHDVYGQIGIDGNVNSSTVAWGNTLPIQTVPVKVMDHVAAVSCGDFHTAAVKTDGTLWVWGSNNAGQLGIPKSTKTQPTPLQERSGVKTVCCGFESLIIMDSDGSLTSWGSYLKSAPTWKDVTAITWDSGWYSGYIRSDGSLWTRGYMHPNISNSNGEALKQMDNVYAAAGGSRHIL